MGYSFNLPFELDREDRDLGKVEWLPKRRFCYESAEVHTSSMPEDQRRKVELSGPQMAALMSKSRDLLFLGSLGAGKSALLCVAGIVETQEYPASVGLMTGASYRALADSLVPTFAEFLDLFGVPYVFRHSDMEFWYPGRDGVRARMAFRSMEAFEKLRGAEFGFIGSDEVALSTEEAMNVAYGRLRCKRKPEHRLRRICATTPRGFDWVYKRWVDEPRKAKAKGKKLSRGIVRARVEDNKHIPQSYVKELRDSYDPRLAQQELDAEFVDTVEGGCYPMFRRMRNVWDGFRPVPYFDVILCMDGNVTPLTGVMLQAWQEGPRRRVHAFDEIVLRPGTFREVAKQVRERLYDGPNPHTGRLLVTGDAANPRNPQTGKTDWDVMEEEFRAAGMGHAEFDFPKSNPRQRDRVNAFNSACLNANGWTAFSVSPRCDTLITDLERVSWDGKGKIDKSDDDLTHASDCVGYYLYQEGYAANRHQTNWGSAHG